MEEDSEFVYLALERCKQSLNDALGKGNPSEPWQFVSQDGQPTKLCMRVGILFPTFFSIEEAKIVS